MKIKIVKDYTKSPKKIYDYGEPQKVIYKFKSISFDLWHNSELSCQEKINKDEISGVNKVLKLNFKKSLNEFIPMINIENEWIPVYFTKSEKYIVCFTMAEKNPSRYQCYLIAVLKVED